VLAAAPNVTAPAPAAVVAAPPSPAAPSRKLRLAGGVTLGVGAAGLASSLILYLVAREVVGPEADRQVRGTPAFNDSLDRFHSVYWSSLALVAVGSALTVAGVVTLAVASRKKSR
jgi:hypothetical protein